MKRFLKELRYALCYLALAVLGLSAVISVALAAEAKVDVGYDDIVTIRVESPSVDELLSAEDSLAVDDLMYPHGVYLPTRYLDAIMFQDYDGDYQVSTSTADFLFSEFPSDGSYTFAEVKTAQMYLGFLRGLNDTSGEVDAEAIKQLDNTFNFVGVGCVPMCDILESLHSFLEEYRDFLSMDLSSDGVELDNIAGYSELLDSESTQLSMGLYFDWDSSMRFERTEGAPDALAKFIRDRYGYIDRLGLMLASVELGDVGYRQYIAPKDVVHLSSPALVPTRESDTTTSSEAGVDVGSSEDVQTEEPSEEGAVDHVDTGDSGGSGNSNGDSILGDSEGYSRDIVEAEPEYSVEAVSTKRDIGWRDVVITLCIFVVVFTVITYGIIDFMRKRKDPTKKYKRW